MNTYVINNAIDGIREVQLDMVSEIQNINKDRDSMKAFVEQLKSYANIIENAL